MTKLTDILKQFLLNEIKVVSRKQNKLSPDKILQLPILDLKIGKYDVSKGRVGMQVSFNSAHAATQDRALKVFNKLGIKPEKTWLAWLVTPDSRQRGYPDSLKSTFILSHYNNEPILIAQTQTFSSSAGQIYLYSKYFKSGKRLRLPDGVSNNIDDSALFADTNATKEQILQALKIPQ